jgi:aminoglycoside phosphotransferase (APT) family kinase protein
LAVRARSNTRAREDTAVSEWDFEIEVNEGLARALIAEQFPSLGVESLRRLGEGWDNTVWVTGEDIAFRFPRRDIAVPGVEREMAILPELAAALPAPIPDADYAAAPNAAFPWPWFGSRLIVGRELAVAGLEVDARATLAVELGGFLGALHGLRPSVATTLAIDPMGRAEMTTRVPRTRVALEGAASPWSGHERAAAVLDAAKRLAPDAEAVFAHGDLNVRHALVSEWGGLAGVIDWGDMCRAPRSVDLPLYWSLFGAGARAAFRAAYGPLTDDTLTRARVLALFFDATLAVYAHDRGMNDLESQALQGLNQTLID